MSFGSRKKVPQQTVVDVVHPAVDRDLLPSRQCVANDGRLADVHDLLDDIQFAKLAVPLLLAAQRVQRRLMLGAYVLNVAEPVVDQSQLLVATRRARLRSRSDRRR